MSKASGGGKGSCGKSLGESRFFLNILRNLTRGWKLARGPRYYHAMNVRDRIKAFRRVKASDLRPNPMNWRTHPENQRNALRGALAEIGYADALLTRELEDGTLLLLDGHLRAETTPDTVVPVLVTDLDEQEGMKLLATLDPLASMAQADKQKLETESEDLAQMIADLAPVMPRISVTEWVHTRAWKAGGMANTTKEDTLGNRNKHRERLWFSPHCFDVTEHPELLDNESDMEPDMVESDE